MFAFNCTATIICLKFVLFHSLSNIKDKVNQEIKLKSVSVSYSARAGKSCTRHTVHADRNHAHMSRWQICVVILISFEVNIEEFLI